MPTFFTVQDKSQLVKGAAFWGAGFGAMLPLLWKTDIFNSNTVLQAGVCSITTALFLGLLASASLQNAQPAFSLHTKTL